MQFSLYLCFLMLTVLLKKEVQRFFVQCVRDLSYNEFHFAPLKCIKYVLLSKAKYAYAGYIVSGVVDP